MNKLKLISIVTILVLTTKISYGQIGGTAHDFSSRSWAPSENSMCAVCHTTHSAMTSVSDAPLWNHTVSSVATYTTYDSPTFDGTSTIGQPGGNSKLCLSCHDGTVALDSFGGASGTSYISLAVGAGADLSAEHPISFEYTTALSTADPGLFDPATKTTPLGGTIVDDMLFNNKLECASCHDVHNRFNHAHLLKVVNDASQLCLTCHDK